MLKFFIGQCRKQAEIWMDSLIYLHTKHCTSSNLDSFYYSCYAKNRWLGVYIYIYINNNLSRHRSLQFSKSFPCRVQSGGQRSGNDWIHTVGRNRNELVRALIRSAPFSALRSGSAFQSAHSEEMKEKYEERCFINFIFHYWDYKSPRPHNSKSSKSQTLRQIPHVWS